MLEFVQPFPASGDGGGDCRQAGLVGLTRHYNPVQPSDIGSLRGGPAAAGPALALQAEGGAPPGGMAPLGKAVYLASRNAAMPSPANTTSYNLTGH